MKPKITDLFHFDQEPNELTNKFYLSTDGYFFFYRLDKYDKQKMRASLYDKTGRVSDIGVNDMTHHDVINCFEARITLKS